MDRGPYKDCRKLVDGGGSKPIVMTFYGGGLRPIEDFYRMIKQELHFKNYPVCAFTSFRHVWIKKIKKLQFSHKCVKFNTFFAEYIFET